MSAFERRIERPYRVRFDEAGPDGQLRASGYLRFAQDLAWIHSESAGFGRDWYSARGLTWLVRAIELDVLSNVEYGSSLDVSTEVIGFRRVWARRRSEFKPLGQGDMVGVAITDWVLLNANGRPVRPPQEILDVFGSDFGEFTPMRMEAPTAQATGQHRRFVGAGPLSRAARPKAAAEERSESEDPHSGNERGPPLCCWGFEPVELECGSARGPDHPRWPALVSLLMLPARGWVARLLTPAD